jgi:hypothetical protein
MGLIKTGIVRRKSFGGGAKLYATGLHYDNIGDEQLIQTMVQNSQIGVASAVAAVHAFRKVVTTFLLNGHTIVVPRLGTFSLSCNGKMIPDTRPAKVETDEEKKQMREFLQNLVNGIENVKVRFTPTPQVTVAAKSAQFQNIIVQDDTNP